MGKDKSLGEIIGKQLIDSLPNHPVIKAMQNPVARQLIQAAQSPYVQLLLKSVANITMGQSPSSETYNTDGNGLPFFQGKADFGNVYPSVRVHCNQPQKTADVNDILISVRAPVGTTNIAN